MAGRHVPFLIVYGSRCRATRRSQGRTFELLDAKIQKDTADYLHFVGFEIDEECPIHCQEWDCYFLGP